MPFGKAWVLQEILKQEEEETVSVSDPEEEEVEEETVSEVKKDEESESESEEEEEEDDDGFYGDESHEFHIVNYSKSKLRNTKVKVLRSILNYHKIDSIGKRLELINRLLEYK